MDVQGRGYGRYQPEPETGYGPQYYDDYRYSPSGQEHVSTRSFNPYGSYDSLGPDDDYDSRFQPYQDYQEPQLSQNHSSGYEYEKYDEYQHYQYPSQPSSQSSQTPQVQYADYADYAEYSQSPQPANGQPYQARRARHARPAEIPRQAYPQPQIEPSRAALGYEHGVQQEVRQEAQSDYRYDYQPAFQQDFPQRTARDQASFPPRAAGPGRAPSLERPQYAEQTQYLDRPAYPERPSYPSQPPYPERPSYPDRSPYSSAPPFPSRAPSVARASSPSAYANGSTATYPPTRTPAPARADRYDSEYDLRPVRRRNVTPSVRPPSTVRHKRSRAPIVVTGMVVIAGIVAIGLEAAGIFPPSLRSRAAAAAGPNALPATPKPTSSAFGPVQAGPTTGSASPVYASLPGVGLHYGSQIPANTSQVVVAYGSGLTSSTATVEFYQKVPGGWQLEDSWAGHNGNGGWVLNKTAADSRSPIGVYSLTDAGGMLPNPGTQLSYVQSSAFQDTDTSSLSLLLVNAFDYVIAINYNHDPGTSPLSTHYPMGADKGTGIWLTVDKSGPTHASVSIPPDGMKTLLLNLNPVEHPVIVMGDKTDLADG